MLPLLSSFVTFEDIMSGAATIFVWIAIKINCCCGSNKPFTIYYYSLWGGPRLFRCRDDFKRSITTTQHYITKGSYLSSTQLVSHTVIVFQTLLLMDSQGDIVFLMAMRCEEAGKKIQIRGPRFPSIPRGLSNVGTTCFVDFLVVTGHLVSVKIISWKCKKRIPAGMKFRSQNHGFPRDSNASNLHNMHT